MPYLISYFAVGIFLASAAALHSTFGRDKALITFAITIFFWPLLILVAPESFLQSDHIGDEKSSLPQDLLKEKLAVLMQDEGFSLTEEERQRLIRATKYGEAQISLFGNEADFEDILSKY